MEEKIELVKSEAERFKTTILLKGATDIISDGKEVYINKTGSPLISKGGTGDTLAGIAGAILARGVDYIQAAHAAAYINGKAGEVASEKKGEGVVASDIFETIPKAIRSVD